MKIILGFVTALFIIGIGYNFTGTINSDVSFAQGLISIILCYSSVFVLIYSVMLFCRSGMEDEEKRKTALRSFAVLFIAFSLITLLFYTELIFLHLFKTGVSKLLIYCIDFAYNAIIVFWSIKHLDSLSEVKGLEGIKSLSAEQIIDKFQISKREQEIIQLVCSGKSNQEIADTLFISLGTVKNHLYNIYIKLGIKNRTQLVKLF